MLSDACWGTPTATPFPNGLVQRTLSGDPGTKETWGATAEAGTLRVIQGHGQRLNPSAGNKGVPNTQDFTVPLSKGSRLP